MSDPLRNCRSGTIVGFQSGSDVAVLHLKNESGYAESIYTNTKALITCLDDLFKVKVGDSIDTEKCKGRKVGYETDDYNGLLAIWSEEK